MPQSTNDNNVDYLNNWRMKILVFCCMLSLPVGCHYLEATLGTLKTTLKHAMQINNTQFSILLSSVTLVNTILPLLSGIFIDDITKIGSIRATVIVSTVIFLGSLLVSISSSINSYPCMITGQIIYGLGGGMIVTMQEGIISRWFRDKELAIVIGIMLSVARLTKWVAKMVTYPILNATGSHAWPIHVATLFCAAGVVMNAGYALIMWRKGLATLSGKELAVIQREYQNELEYQTQTTPKGNQFKWSPRILLYIPSSFWMIPWIQFTMSSVLSSFDDVATEYVEFRYQTTSVIAGYQSSLTQVVPIVLAPIMGFIVHKYGKRLTFLFIATLILILSMVLLAYTWVSPVIGMIIFSFALALGPVSVLSSTSLLLPHELAGTGMGFHKCGNNIGTTIVSVLVGYVQDLTYHDGNPHDNAVDLQNEYNGVMIFYMALAAFSTLIVVVFWWMDRVNLKGWLQANLVERQRRLESVKLSEQQEKKLDGLEMIGSRLRKKPSVVYVGVFGAWLVVAWVIFFVFALMPVYQSYM